MGKKILTSTLLVATLVSGAFVEGNRANAASRSTSWTEDGNTYRLKVVTSDVAKKVKTFEDTIIIWEQRPKGTYSWDSICGGKKVTETYTIETKSGQKISKTFTSNFTPNRALIAKKVGYKKA